MPRLPEPPPSGELGAQAFGELMEAGKGPLIALVQKANKSYLYWDEFKYQPMPDGVTPEEAWRFLKLMRSFGRTYTPVLDVHGHSFTHLQTEEVQRCLHVIDQQAGGPVTGAGVGASSDARTRYLVSSLMEEAIASSRVEGASTTRRVAKEMLRTGREPRDVSERMIINNYRAVSMLRDLKDEPITTELILKIQASLTRGTLDRADDVGQVRRGDDIIVHDELNRILHQPPPAAEIPRELERLCQYANEDGSTFLHPVIKAIVLHFWLAYLHPFADGNGRTARALFYLHMLKKDYWLFEFLSISRVILNRRSQYDRAYLYAETDDCDLTYFVNFNLHAIERAVTDLWAYLDRKATEDHEIAERVRHDGTLNYRQRALLTRAIEDADAAFTIESHRTSHDVAYATARADLFDLAERGYLARRKDGRTYVFTPAEGLRQRLGAE